MKRSTCRGFTLIEVMAVTALAGTIMIPMVRLLPNVISFFHRPSLETQMAMAADPAFNNMLRFLRGAQAQSVAIKTPLNEPLYSQIQFRTINTNGSQPGHFYDFEQNGTQLQMSVDHSTAQTLVDNVQSVSFVLPHGASDPYTILITLKLRTTDAGGTPYQFFLQGQVRLNAI